MQILRVAASAGSGKTFALSKKYLEIALNFDISSRPDVASVMAVTFANKAAIEMKSRIIEYLKRLALGDAELIKTLNLNIPRVQEKSKILLECIFARYDSFNVKTIDSFVNSVVKACALNLNISPNFQIETDYKTHLNLAADIFIERSVSEPALKQLVISYLKQYMLSEKSSWFPAGEIYAAVDKLFLKNSNLAGALKSFYEENFDGTVKTYCQSIGQKMQKFLTLAEKLNINAGFKKGVAAALKPNGYFDFSGKLSKYLQYGEIAYLKNVAPNAKAEALWTEIKKELSALYNYYSLYYYGVYTEIYSHISGVFHKNAVRDELVFLSDISGRAKELFERSGNMVPEIYYRLSERYKHFLIDEFQDTNNIQWAGIKRFLVESLSSGGTFFYVGDAKQAIYQFRGGNSEIFLNVSEFAEYGANDVVLATNYRSHKTIVEFNNTVFSQENLEMLVQKVFEKDEILGGVLGAIEKVYKNSAQKYLTQNDKGYVEFTNIEDGADEKSFTKEWLIKTVAEGTSARFESADIAVLCRTNADVALCSRWLLGAGFNVSSSQTLNIKNYPLVKEMLSFLSFISSPIDNLNFASFITGEIFGKVSGISAKDIETFLFESARTDAPTLYIAFRDKFKEAWDKHFEKFFVSAGFVSISEFCADFLARFQVLQNFAGAKIYFMRLLELVQKFEAEYSGLNSFLEYFNALDNAKDELFIKNAPLGGVNIMTVHQAKGLEFAVVLLPFLALAEADVKPPFFDALDTGENYLLQASKNSAAFSVRAKEVFNKERVRSFIGELNILYVALTRAKCEMYICAARKAGKRNNLINAFFGEQKIFGAKEKYNLQKTKSLTVNIPDIPYKKTETETVYEKFSFAARDKRARGKILHYGLSLITTLKNQNVETVLENVERQITRVYNVSGIAEAISKLLENPEIRAFFNYDEVYNEKTFADAFGNTLRVDKLIIAQNKAIIVDFKSSATDIARYSAQMQKYIDVVGEVYGLNTECFIVDITAGKVARVK